MHRLLTQAEKEAALKTSRLADAAASVAALEAKHAASALSADTLQRQCTQLQDEFFRYLHSGFSSLSVMRTSHAKCCPAVSTRALRKRSNENQHLLFVCLCRLQRKHDSEAAQRAEAGAALRAAQQQLAEQAQAADAAADAAQRVADSAAAAARHAAANLEALSCANELLLVDNQHSKVRSAKNAMTDARDFVHHVHCARGPEMRPDITRA